jgi:hypothetical protein
VKKTIAALVSVVMIAVVMGVSFAVAATSVPRVNALSPTSITIINYSKEVTVGKEFNITGTFTSGGTGLGNKVVYYELQNKDGQWVPGGWYITTNADGSFIDGGLIAGHKDSWSFRYEFGGDAQYSPCFSDVFIITAS